jgi:uncharacterized membrane protein
MIEDKFSPARLAAFSDGVIAVIITIMVLDLKVPHEPVPGALLRLWPSFISYALSYLFVGIVWINHHHLLRDVQRTSRGLIGTNLVFLFFVSLIPFFTVYVAETRLNAFPTAIYAGVFLCVTLAFMFFEYATRESSGGAVHRDRPNDPSTWRNWVALALYAVAIPAAYFHSAISLALIFSVAIIYCVP